MKSPKTKKVVRGWAVFGNNNETLQQGSLRNSHYRLAIFGQKRLAESMAKVAPLSWYVVPCTITFSLPTKKSAGKVGKRV